MTYKQFSIKIAKQAGAVIRKNFVMGMKKEWKSNETPVTKTDIAVNKMVINEVKKHFSTHDILGEEESHRPNNSDYLWVCDPVDGTVPFSHGVPTFVFSLALVHKGRPILGVIYDPILDRLLFAEQGKGAFFNGKKIKVNKKGMDRAALCWCSNRLVWPLIKKYRNCFPMNFYSYVYGAMLVPMGEFVAALYTGPYAHDAAAIKIIIEEAGGKATDLNGNEQRYDGPIRGCLISNGVVHEQLVQIAKKHPSATGALKKNFLNTF